MSERLGLSGRIAHAFIDSKLTPLIIVASIAVGGFAVLKTPREEEPQIKVPMIDVFVQAPGMSVKEVEERVTKPMEKLLWEIPGVEYIYSTTMPGMSMAVVRFYVGEDEEDSVLKTYNKMYSNFDRIPPGVSQPIIKPRWIDDVAILALTFWGEGYDGYSLRRIAARLCDELKNIQDVSETMLIGGRRRQIRVVLDPARMAGFHVSPMGVSKMLQAANQQLVSGQLQSGNEEVVVESGLFLGSAEDVGRVVLGSFGGRPVYLADVATIVDGPEEPDMFVRIGFGRGAAHVAHGEEAQGHSEYSAAGREHEAVTISLAKRKGKNAIVIARKALDKVAQLRGTLIPEGVHVTVTRNYGETSNEKSNELLFHMGIATVSVTLLILLALGWRESGVVAIAVPVTLALTLAVFYLYGYTLNRITLFALIFSIGILVDDAIVVVENIVRHFRMPESRGRPLIEVASEAVDEVGNPTILATFAVIAAILPLAFVSGLMGPYMRPIPVGASAAMLFSLIVAFVISPWASLRILKSAAKGGGHGHGGEKESWTTRVYRRIMGPLLRSGWVRALFFLAILALLAGACSLVYFKIVTVKMLPFDNKSEFQIIIDTPEGTTLEQTTIVAQEIGEYLATVEEVTDYQVYAGTAAPYNFNGLVRHYFLRRGPNVADIQVNLLPKHARKAQSHDVAKKVRPPIEKIAQRHGASIKVAEVPPGPPVLQTLVAEVYGPDYEGQKRLAAQIKEVFEQTEGVVDVDWYVEEQQPKVVFEVDKVKAALAGISTEQVTHSLRLALSGMPIGLAHMPEEKEDVLISLRLPLEERSSVAELAQVRMQAPDGRLVPLSQLVRIRETVTEQSIYHKNLMPVTYVTADIAGRQESPVYAILKLNKAIDEKIRIPEGYQIQKLTTRQPFLRDKYAMKWDGEWHITYEVFRDLGIAFAAVMVLIYVLTVGWFRSFATPITIMSVIPISLVGILPGHALLGAFFTATSMIGFIAGAGIVVRNSIILVDFIELRLREGMPLREAVVDAGAVRFRPMMLTAAAVVVGSAVILRDPIFQGLAVALMAGEVASLLLSRMAVPVLYYMQRRRELEGRTTVADESAPTTTAVSDQGSADGNGVADESAPTTDDGGAEGGTPEPPGEERPGEGGGPDEG